VQSYGFPLVVPDAEDEELSNDDEPSSGDFAVAPPVLEMVQPYGNSSPVYPIMPATTVPDYSQPEFTVNSGASPSSFRTTDSYGNTVRTMPDASLGVGGYRSIDNRGNTVRTMPDASLGVGGYRSIDNRGNTVRTMPDASLGVGGYRSIDNRGNTVRTTPDGMLGGSLGK
jgi:hypothetical protein